MAVDRIIHRHGFSAPRERFHGLVAEGKLDGERALVLKPETYMNRSGLSVGAAMQFYKLTLSDIVVFYDELDLAPGKLRMKQGGGAAGHNGIRSIDSQIGNDYRRCRIGIGHPGDRDLVSGWVLSNFTKSDQAWLDPLLDAVAEAAPVLTKHKDAAFASRVHLILSPPKEKNIHGI